jgi:hypothetical protein
MKKTPYTEEQFQRLPQWTKQLITDLKREAANAKRELAEYEDTQTPSHFYTRRYVSGEGEKKRYIQDRRVTVECNEHVFDIGIRENGDRLRVEVMLEHGILAVVPSASNVVFLETLKKVQK